LLLALLYAEAEKKSFNGFQWGHFCPKGAEWECFVSRVQKKMYF